MLSTGGSYEFEPTLVPELQIGNDPEFDDERRPAGAAPVHEQATGWEPSFEEHAFGLRASAERRPDDGDEDSDFGFDDFDHDEKADDDEDLDDDLDDQDEELADDLDDFEGADEL